MTGQLFSFTPSFQIHAFITSSDGAVQNLGDPAYTSVGWDINDAGEVTGYEARSLSGDRQSAFRFSSATKTDLGTLGGARSSGISINNAGVVVGWSEGPASGAWSRAFRVRPGFPMEDLGGIISGAYGVNDAGEIVGWYERGAFLYTDADGMTDLNSRAGAQGFLDYAYAINAAGQIVVTYQLAGRTGTYRLTPLVDTEPPVITAATVSPNLLTPPDGRMVPVVVQAYATDNFSPAPTCRIASVTNDEAPASGADPDVVITGPFTVSLRAFRLGTGAGRTYTIAVRCTDSSGNAATAELSVRVPHDAR